MITTWHPTASERVAKCPHCGDLPHHVEHFGRTRAETMDFSVPAHRHSLECACGRTTARHASLADAETEWGVAETQIPMALPMNVTRIPRRKPKGARA